MAMHTFDESPRDMLSTIQKIPALAVSHPAIFLLGAILVYLFVIVIYRLYFSPLAKFPGPKIAAVTSWYACYHDLWRGGQYIWAVKDMHKKYGPIVRVRPDVLSINDPNFIDQIYSGAGHRRDRYRTSVDAIAAPGSVLTSKGHDLHKRRRAILNPYFSKQNVRRLEPVNHDTLINLLSLMDKWARMGGPAPIHLAYQAALKDVISTYAFGDGEKALERDDLDQGFLRVVGQHRTAHIGAYFPWVNTLMMNMHPSLLLKIYPQLINYLGFMNRIEARIEEVRNAKDRPEGKTIFHEIFNSNLPESEKTTRRMTDEGIILVMAGTMSTAGTMQALTYHLLSTPHMLKRLKAELESAMPDPNQLPDGTKLDKLPYLNALIHEVIRLHPGVSQRQDRVAPDEDLTYTAPNGKTYIINAGIAVGMSATLVNRDESLYPDPEVFRPERYLENPGLVKYQLTFSRGSRMCIGMNLAFLNLQMMTAGIFRKYDLYDGTGKQTTPTLELYETTRDDVECFADYVVPAAKPGSKGVRLIIRH